jgi:hypothetical protein
MSHRGARRDGLRSAAYICALIGRWAPPWWNLKCHKESVFAGRLSALGPCGLPHGLSGPRPELRVDSRDVCFCLDYGWRVLLDPPMPAGRFTETPPDQSLVRHGAGAFWCLQRLGDSRRCEKSGRIRRARPGRRRIPRPALSSGSASPSRVRGRLTRLRARSPYGVEDGSIRGTASSVPCGEFRGWAARGKWVGSPVCARAGRRSRSTAKRASG